jgi:ERF superfamily protein
MKTAKTNRRSPESSRRRAKNAARDASASVGSGPASGSASLRVPPERKTAACAHNPETAKIGTLTARYHMAPSKEQPSMETDTMPAEVAAVDLPAPTLEGPLDASGLIAKAIEHNVGIDTLERLLALRERLKAEQAREAFLRALAAFQGECPVIVKSKTVTIQPQTGRGYSYRYAPLDVIVEQIRPYLQKYGLSYTIKTRQDDGSLTAICEAHHEAGHTEPSELTVPIDRAARMNDTQKVGAARTYAMRYAFCNAFGILTGDEDTDAVTASEVEEIAPFEAPRRQSEPTTAPLPLPTAADEDLADKLRRSIAETAAPAAPAGDDVPPPSDALSKPRVGRLMALLHTAVEGADVPQEAHEEIFTRALDWLAGWVATTQGRAKVTHCSYKRYDELCAQIPVAVEAALQGERRPAPRLVRRTYAAPRRPLH